MLNLPFICDFLAKVEGPRQIRGYVPAFRKSDGKGRNYIGRTDTPSLGVQFPATGSPLLYKAMGASGVTIATGCDLGQTSLETLKSYGLDDQSILSQLKPYIGLKKDAALLKLFTEPLLISGQSALAIDQAVHGGYLRRFVRPAYDKASRIPFDDLPKEAQAVFFSLCFQKGCAGVARDWPLTMKYMATQNWKAASHELQHGFKEYAGRRRLEGKLLEALL